MKKRREVKVKNNPGIFKVQLWDEKASKWIDSGKFRSTRRVRIEGVSKKESGFFEFFEDAKQFRLGKLEREETGGYHKQAPTVDDSRMRFSTLLGNWKDFHYQTVDYSTKQTYERKLPLVEKFLAAYVVDEINPSVIDKMIKEWKNEYANEQRKGAHNAQRYSFDKELDALKVVLNFYRKREDSRFPIPVFAEHYRASKLVIKADHGVRSLKQEDLGLFFRAMSKQKDPQLYVLALAQFCLSLRIGEVCAIYWDDIDLKRREITIQRAIVWDHENWQPMIKEYPKNGKARVLSIPEILIPELERMKASRNPKISLIFHKNGRPLIRKSIGQAYNRALKASNITYVSGTHLVRKTSATQANAETGDFHAVSQNLGHSNVEETQRYVEGLSEGKRKVARALNKVALKVLNGGRSENNVTPGPQWPANDDEAI